MLEVFGATEVSCFQQLQAVHTNAQQGLGRTCIKARRHNKEVEWLGDLGGRSGAGAIEAQH